MDDVREMMRELKAERPRRYFDLECWRLLGISGDESIRDYRDTTKRFLLPEKTLHVLTDLSIWLKIGRKGGEE